MPSTGPIKSAPSALQQRLFLMTLSYFTYLWSLMLLYLGKEQTTSLSFAASTHFPYIWGLEYKPKHWYMHLFLSWTAVTRSGHPSITPCCNIDGVTFQSLLPRFLALFRAFWCWKVSFGKSTKENPNNHKEPSVPTPQWHSIGSPFCARGILAGVHMFSFLPLMKTEPGIAPCPRWWMLWQLAHEACVATCRHKTVIRPDNRFLLLPFQTRPPHPLQRTCVSVRSSLPFHHLFFIAPTLNQLQHMKGIISDSGHHDADFAVSKGCLCCVGLYCCHGRPGSTERKCLRVLDISRMQMLHFLCMSGDGVCQSKVRDGC